MANQISPTDLAKGLSEFFHKWGFENLKIVVGSDSAALELLYGTAIVPINLALAVGEYHNLVTNEGYSPSDAITKVGSEIIGGLAGAIGGEALLASFPFLESPITIAIAGSFGSFFGTLAGGELADALRSYMLAQSNELRSYLSAPTGFTATPSPTPVDLAGTYNATTSSQSPSGNSHGIKVSAMQQAESDGYYVVQADNTLSDIAKKFGTTMEAIMGANPSITNANMIYAGQQITLPTGATNWLSELGKQSGEIIDFLKSVTEPMETVRENIRENMIFNDPEVPEPGDVESTAALKRSSLDALAERVLSRRIRLPEWVPIKNRGITADIYIRGDRVVFTRTNDMNHHVSVRVHRGWQFNMDSDSAGEPMQDQRGQENTESEIW